MATNRVQQRLGLADELLRALASNDDAGTALHPDWKHEFEQRVADIESGRAKLVSSAEANATLREAIASARRRQ